MTGDFYVGSSANSLLTIVSGTTGTVSGFIALPGPIAAVAVDSEHRRAYLSGLSGSVYVVDLDGATVIAEVNLGTTALGAIAVDPTTRTVYASTPRGSVLYRIDATTNTLASSVDSSFPGFTALAVDPTSHRLFAGTTSFTGTRIFDGDTLDLIGVLPTRTFARSFAIDPAQQLLYVGGGSVNVYDLSTDALVTVLSGTNGRSITLDSTREHLYTANFDGTFVVTDTNSRTELGRFAGPPEGTFGVPAVDPQSGTIAFASNVVSKIYLYSAPYVLTPAPAATVDVPYQHAYALPSAPDTTLSLTAGTLPPGITISPDGTLAGTPEAAGTYTFTVTATNIIGPPASRTDTVTVAAAAVPPTITGSAGYGIAGSPLEYTYVVGGAPAPEVTLTAGALPDGVTLSSTGQLSGTATTPGTYSFTLTASNGFGEPAVLSDTITIDAPPPTTTPTPPPTTVPSVTTLDRTIALPATGADPRPPLATAIAMLGLGVMLLARRRTHNLGR
ncbi:DNA-binding beta-propeller fold protein YncE [Plantibacter flavus]|uniref:DNA-binding beta-propeller fold protein YncE n=1 Tax=Plantibacter flavus TaxID=150123 RepID=A0A3N2BXK2_9MICO|nr:DNA-binding beta-propeller fold protein YncE [Plantibacter flavus]